MTDQSSPQPSGGGGKTTMYRPSVEGGLEVAPTESGDYRDRLQSRRWNAAPLTNPEVEKTNPWLALLAIVALAAVTLIVLLLGYGVLDLWSLPA